jgi:hypothetical protein
MSLWGALTCQRFNTELSAVAPDAILNFHHSLIRAPFKNGRLQGPALPRSLETSCKALILLQAKVSVCYM